MIQLTNNYQEWGSGKITEYLQSTLSPFKDFASRNNGIVHGSKDYGDLKPTIPRSPQHSKSRSHQSNLLIGHRPLKWAIRSTVAGLLKQWQSHAPARHRHHIRSASTDRPWLAVFSKASGIAGTSVEGEAG